jgi:drug/metabolite transporter (DMT)-like permease
MRSGDRLALVSGPVCVLTFCLINAVKSVFEGALVQHISPEFLAFNYFVLAQVIYFGLYRDKRQLAAVVRRCHRDVLAFNVTTALSWLAVLYALVAFEPVVVNSLITGLVPSLTILLGLKLRPGAVPRRIEVVAAAGVLATMVYLAAVSLQGSSGLGRLRLSEWTLGVAACLVTAAAVAGNTHFTKRLSEAGMTVPAMMASRFPLLLVASAVIITVRGSATPYSPELTLTFIGLAVIGVFGALHVLQVGISRTEPTTVSLLFGSNLILTFLFQYFDPRVRQSALTLAGVLVLTAFIVLGARTRNRANRPADQKQSTAAAK